MTTTARRFSAAPFVLAVTLLAAFILLFAPAPASAHDSLLASDPAADSTVDTLPAELTLTFSAKLIDGEGATEVVVTDPAGDSVIEGPATVDGAIVTQRLTAGGEAGRYHVIWKVVSSDGHPTSGEFFFSVAAGTAETADPTPSAAPSAEATVPASSPEPTASSSDGTPADGDSFLRMLPWIVVLVVVIAAAGALVAVLVARARRTPPASDSEPPAEG